MKSKITIIHGPNSAYYRKKADDVYGDLIKILSDFQCVLTFKQGRERKRDGLRVVGLDTHHLIERVQYGYRWDINNGISLAKVIHGSHPNFRSHKFNAHGTKEERDRFEEIVEKMCPEQYKWWEIHKEIKKRTTPMTFEWHFEHLTELMVKELEKKKYG